MRSSNDRFKLCLYFTIDCSLSNGCDGSIVPNIHINGGVDYINRRCSLLSTTFSSRRPKVSYVREASCRLQNAKILCCRWLNFFTSQIPRAIVFEQGFKKSTEKMTSQNIFKNLVIRFRENFQKYKLWWKFDKKRAQIRWYMSSWTNWEISIHSPVTLLSVRTGILIRENVWRYLYI